jgi:hypothetical protein
MALRAVCPQGPTHAYRVSELEKVWKTSKTSPSMMQRLQTDLRDWHSIDWKLVTRFVGKAQMRIAQAELDRDYRSE